MRFGKDALMKTYHIDAAIIHDFPRTPISSETKVFNIHTNPSQLHAARSSKCPSEADDQRSPR